MLIFYVFPSLMMWSLPFPPSEIHPGSFLYKKYCPSPLSFRPICLLSARFCVFSRPPPASGPHIVRPPSSVRRKATNPPAIGRTMSSPGFLTQRPKCRFAPPPYLCGRWYLAWVWGKGCTVSFTPSPTPKPSTTSRTGKGGVQTCIWDAGLRNQERTLFGR